MDPIYHITKEEQEKLQRFLDKMGVLMKHPSGRYMLINSEGAHEGWTLRETIQRMVSHRG